MPLDHVASVCAADEDVYTEMRNFQKAIAVRFPFLTLRVADGRAVAQCVVRMFDAFNLDVVFYETAGSLHRSRHAAIECIPMVRIDYWRFNNRALTDR